MNNFQKIKPVLKFENENDFYFIQILKRRKDNPEMDRDVKVIKSFYIFSQEELDKCSTVIIHLCEFENARAYIRLNRRNLQSVGIELLKERVRSIEMNGDNERTFEDISFITSTLRTRRYADILTSFTASSQDRKLFDSVCGSTLCDKDKTWIVDIDYVNGNDPENIEEIFQLIYDLQKLTGKEPKMLHIDSKNGFHIITRPFNLQSFRYLFPTIDIHKDNPTILYCK